jgi:hypothetical protein
MSILCVTLACAVLSLPAAAAAVHQPRPAVSPDALVALANRLNETNLESSSLAPDLSRQTGAVFAPRAHGAYPVMLSGPVQLAGGPAIDSIELTQQLGVLSRIVIILSDAPCVDAKALASALHAGTVSSGGLPSPRPEGSAIPTQTFYTGDYSGTTGDHRIRIGFKHWTPDDVICATSLTIEQ